MAIHVIHHIDLQSRGNVSVERDMQGKTVPSLRLTVRLRHVTVMTAFEARWEGRHESVVWRAL